MAIGGSNYNGGGDGDAVQRRDMARDKSRAEADRDSGYYNSASTSWGDRSYMTELGKAGVRRQQERMSDAAGDEGVRIQRRQPNRMAKRTPPKAAAKRK